MMAGSGLGWIVDEKQSTKAKHPKPSGMGCLHVQRLILESMMKL
jgi:hypothetical protein